MAKDLRATRDYMRDKRAGTLNGRKWTDYKSNEPKPVFKIESQSGARINFNILKRAGLQYGFDMAIDRQRKSVEGLMPGASREEIEANAVGLARAEAKELTNDLIDTIKRYQDGSKRYGYGVVVSDNLPKSYKNLTPYGFMRIGYQGIPEAQSEYQKKEPLYNPKSALNRAYIKQYGNVPLIMGIEIPKELMSIYDGLRRKKKR